MSDNNNWKDLGIKESSWTGSDPSVHTVENTKTGEQKEVVVGAGEEVGTAIANGQWRE